MYLSEMLEETLSMKKPVQKLLKRLLAEPKYLNMSLESRSGRHGKDDRLAAAVVNKAIRQLKSL